MTLEKMMFLNGILEVSKACSSKESEVTKKWKVKMEWKKGEVIESTRLYKKDF